MSSSQPLHALVFGASGISGWAIVKEALNYPSKRTFASVTGLTNRPLSLPDASLPSDSRLQLASGVDLTASSDSIVDLLKSKVPHIQDITHVFFTAYIEKPDYQDAKQVNTSLLSTAVDALEQLCPNLQVIILQTGGKAYGVEFSQDVKIVPPLREDYPRIPKPWCDNIFYYAQYDVLETRSRGAKWKFAEVRPDVIVGFVPTTNFMNAALGLALYLSLYREVHGDGAEAVFPGTQTSWTNLHTDTFQDVLAKMELFVALGLSDGKIQSGESINCADGDVTTWEKTWPGICAWFGLKGVGPKSNGRKVQSFGEFAKSHEDTWENMVKQAGLRSSGMIKKFGWDFLQAIAVYADFDRQYDLSKGKELGFSESIDTVDGYKISFERFREAKTIP